MLTNLDTIVSLCKRRGFIFQSSEIYNGLASAWDYGPLGVELKKNIQNHWWKKMVHANENVVGLDSAILMHPTVWSASGHVENFIDVLVEDTVTRERFRYDHLTEEQRQQNRSPAGNPLGPPKNFNLMFATQLGSTEESKMTVYLRPETAQGIYVNFKNVQQSTRLKLPFGVAQVGKAFRNELVFKNFIFRTCEFEQMEMQFFVPPSEDEKHFRYWMDERMKFYAEIGIREDYLRFKEHKDDELAHYAKAAYDIEYNFPFGWSEIEGIHNRTDFDLRQHMKFSKKDLSYQYPEGQKVVPYIIETSAGLTRNVLLALCDAYEEDEAAGEQRVFLRLHPKLAPYLLAVLPLVKKDGLSEQAKDLFLDLQDEYSVLFDATGSIGKRYRRQDEIGTPLCVTVDYQTKEDSTVTIRDRDSLAQERIPISKIREYCTSYLRSYKRTS